MIGYEPAQKDDDLRVYGFCDSSEPILPLLSPELIPPSSELYSKHESVLKEKSSLQPFGGLSAFESSTEQPLPSFSSEHSQASFRSLSHQSDSLESDSDVTPMPDLYIFESDTRDVILSPNVDPQEIRGPEYPTFTHTEGVEVLRYDSAEVLRHHQGSVKEWAVMDNESDVSQHTGPSPTAACETDLMSVNDVRHGKVEVNGLTSQGKRSDSPIELWLDACQYLAGEDTDNPDILGKMDQCVIQEGLSATNDFTLQPEQTQVSGYKAEGSSRIGWSGDDTKGWGPPVERWSSVDSWASALSDWTELITASPEEITSSFTEIGAEIDALTQALAEVNTHVDSETLKGDQQEAQTQPAMGVQDQLLEEQNIPESPVLSGQSHLSFRLEAAGPELKEVEGSQSAESLCDSTATTQEEKEAQAAPCPRCQHSSMTSPGGYNGVTTTLTPGCTVDLDLSHFDLCVESLEGEIFISKEQITLKIIEDTDLIGQDTSVELISEQPSSDGVCEVTKEHRVQPTSETKQGCEPAVVDHDGIEASADLHSLATQTLRNSHVQGVDGEPGWHINVPTHVSLDTLADLDGTGQVEPQWGSPKFIMPLAPLSISSSLRCRTSTSLEGDQTSAKESFSDNRDLTRDHVSPLPTTYGITDTPYLEGDKQLIHKKESTIDFAEGQQDLHTERKTIIEGINDLSREVSSLSDVAADHFVISAKNRVAFITLDLSDPFVSRSAVQSEKAELNPKKAEKMPHKTNKSSSESKTRSKKEKSAVQHHQTSKKQDTHHVPAQQTCKQKETPPAENQDMAPELEDKQDKRVTEAGVAAEKAKPHGKKKKKHGQSAAGVKSVVEPPVEVENGAKAKTAKGRIDMFEAKLGAKAAKPQKDSDPPGRAGKPQPEPRQGGKPPHHTEHEDHPAKTSPLNDDIVKRRRLSEDKFGKLVSVLETKLAKPPGVSTQVKSDSVKDVGATRRKAYSEVVKQKTALPKEDPKVVQPIQAASVSGDPQSLCLWCQFAAVSSDYTVTWRREGVALAEVKRSAGDESRVSLTVSNTSHKDLGKYQCCLSSLQGSVTLDYLLTYEVLSEIVIPPTPKTISDAAVEVGMEEEDVNCSRLLFKEDFLSEQHFGENHPVSIVTEKTHFGEGMHRRAFRTKLQAGQVPLLLPGHSCVLKVHNAISYGTKNNDELIQKNFTLAVEECQVQNTAREYIKEYTAAAQAVEAFGQVPEIIPIYLVHRPSNDIPYATLEEELIGDFVKYSVKDGKEINLMRRDSEAGRKCCAFQHWVYHKTDGNLLVTDMQGVGMRLTDVGIATCKKGYKGFKGNCATSFIDQFKALHQCNPYCEILGLKSLQPKPRKPAPAPKPKPQPSSGSKKKTFGPSVMKGKS
ncbi:alpha-protein kinase 2 [Aulostomus maculatus]